MTAVALREVQPFGLPPEMHGRRIDEKLLLFNRVSAADPATARLAVIAVTARRTGGKWQVAVVDPASADPTPFGSFVEEDGSLSQRDILSCAADWIGRAVATKRVCGPVYPNLNPFAVDSAVGYLLVEADVAPPVTRAAAPDVSCDTCVAACCRKGISIFLTDKEYSQQRRNMSLRRVKAAVSYQRELAVRQDTVDIAGHRTTRDTVVSVPKYHGVYVLAEDCGNLGPAPGGGEDRPCRIHHDPELYPQACRSFEVGSDKCLAQRAAFGLDGHRAARTL